MSNSDQPIIRTAPTRKPGTIAALFDWTATMQGLIARDLVTKFIGSPMGYIWTFVNPLVWIAMIYVMFSFMGRRTPIHTDIISFLLTGLLPYFVFRSAVTATMRSLKAHKYMVYFGKAQQRDILLAAAIAELLNSLVIMGVLIMGNLLFFNNFEIDNPTWALVGYLCAWGIGASFGHMALALEEVFPVTPKLVPIILRPTFWISGLFFIANELPSKLMYIFQYNPLFHAIEIMRTGFFLSYESRTADIFLPLAFIMGMNVIAVMVKIVSANKQGMV